MKNAIDELKEYLDNVKLISRDELNDLLKKSNINPHDWVKVQQFLNENNFECVDSEEYDIQFNPLYDENERFQRFLTYLNKNGYFLDISGWQHF